jgi:hypothetical protein
MCSWTEDTVRPYLKDPRIREKHKEPSSLQASKIRGKSRPDWSFGGVTSLWDLTLLDYLQHNRITQLLHVP